MTIFGSGDRNMWEDVLLNIQTHLWAYQLLVVESKLYSTYLKFFIIVYITI